LLFKLKLTQVNTDNIDEPASRTSIESYNAAADRRCDAETCSILHPRPQVLALVTSLNEVKVQWRSQDFKLGYSYFHVNKKNQLFLTVMSENTTKYEPI